MLILKNCKVRWDRENYIPKKVYGFETEPLEGTPKEIAEKFLKENLQPLKISTPLLSDMRFDKTSKSLGASTVLFQQYFEGKPIHGAWVAVHIDKQNRVFMVKNDTVPVTKLETKIKRAKAASSLTCTYFPKCLNTSSLIIFFSKSIQTFPSLQQLYFWHRFGRSSHIVHFKDVLSR